MGSQQNDAHAVRAASPADATAPAHGSAMGLPAPTTGAAASDLVSSSNDPAVLRDLLERARERLAFYESFDRIIGENIRRSGELMVETVALREQARTQAAEFAAERAAFDASRRADRESYRRLVQEALDDVAATRPVIDGLIERLQVALVGFGEDAAGTEDPSTTAPSPEPVAVPVTAEPAPAPVPAPAVEFPPEIEAEAEPVPEPVPDAGEDASPTATPTRDGIEAQGEAAPDTGPTTIEEDAEASAEPVTGPHPVEILAHGVQTAAIAIALQRTLRELEKVSSVEAREFANGVLRLQVVVDGTIQSEDISAWLETNDGRITAASDSVLEITLGSDDAS